MTLKEFIIVADHRLEYIEYVIPGVIISLVTLIAISFLLRVRTISDEHTSRNEAVAMINVDSKTNFVTFRFSNYLYALHFAKANNSELKTKNWLKYSRNRSLLRGRSAFQVSIWVIVLSLIGHSIAYFILDDNWTSRRSPRSSSYDRQNNSRRTPRTPRSSSYGRQNNGYSQKSSSLISEINTGKQNLKTMETEIQQIDFNIEEMSREINLLKSKAKGYESAAANGQYVNQYPYDSVIEKHNKLIKEYNSILSQRQSKYFKYEQELKKVNGLIDRYN